jgi:4-amino-4-deoxy-L-arabinose transferase-like glycosyltransferase
MFFTASTTSKKSIFSSSFFPGTILAVVYFLGLLPWLGKNRLLGLDESMYADIVLSEARDNHWWPMIFHGQPFWDKPPLLFWLQGLTVKWLGANEFSLRVWSALAGAFCVYFVTRLGAVLGKNIWAGLSCALVLILQEHFILYSRVTTIDMSLLSCLLAVWWQLTQAFHSSNEKKANQELLYAGLWMMAAVALKSWHGFVLTPALLLALIFCRPWPFLPKQVFIRLFLPALLFMTAWMTCNILSFGMPYLKWEWAIDVAARAQGSSFGSLPRMEYHWEFYGILAQEGMAFFWPFLPLCFFLWVREGWRQSSRNHFDVTSIIGSSFFFYYLLFILVFISTFINYILPLVPVSALSAAFLFRFADDRRVALAAGLAALLGLLSGFTGDEYFLWVFSGSFAICLLLVLPQSWGLRKEAMAALLAVWVLGCGFKTQDYWRNPPDPNRVWVLAVLSHPALYRGEPLYFVGEETDARVLEFYSDYQIYPLPQIPAQQPDGALLFADDKRVVYLPMPSKNIK